jgi:hypothetical protein
LGGFFFSVYSDAASGSQLSGWCWCSDGYAQALKLVDANAQVGAHSLSKAPVRSAPLAALLHRLIFRAAQLAWRSPINSLR